MKGLSVVIITYNEEENIRGCLGSVRWADEVVAVDSFSTDQTAKICQEYTDKVYQRPWPGYGLQKNFGIEQASGTWILIVDADERVTLDLKQEILEVIAGTRGEGVVAYELPRKNHYYGRWVRWAGQYPDYQIRLFKKGKAWYNDKKLHENLRVDGKISRLEHPLEHDSYSSLSDWLKKLMTYSHLMAEEQFVSRNRVSGYDLLVRPVSNFLKVYIFKSGCREGIRGMIISAFASLFTFLKYARMWEKLYGK
jgi:glycosyltransferase involved in cell wall biosynthesis